MLRSTRHFLRAGTALVFAAGAITQALAGGFAVHEQSAYGQGSSFAGIAAGGSLQAMYWNPAVMTQFAGMQSASSYTAFFPHVVNTPGAGSAFLTLGGTNNTYENALIPAGYFSYQINPSLWLGMSLNSPFGLSTGFPELWAGRNYAAGSTWLRTYNAAPSIAYRVNDWISIGLGVQIQYAKASLQQGVSLPRFPLAGDSILQGDGWSYGLTAGVTLTPTPTTTVGIGYRSGLNQKLSGTLDVQAVGAFPASTTINLPDTVSLGIRQRIDPQWTLLGTAEWTNWSRIGTANIVVNGPISTSLPFQYRDGWFFSGGVEYQANDRLTLRTGAAYEISPVDDQVRMPLIPDNNRVWASIGASYVIIKGLKADLAYSHVWVDDASINISPTSGNPWFPTKGVTYIGTATSHADIISIGLNWQWDYIFK